MNKFLFGKSDRKVQFIAKLGIMLALTVAVQYLVGTISGGQQIIVGSAVNLFLILATLLTGLVGGVVVGLATPFVGFALGLAGNVTLLPFIAISNGLYCGVFSLLIYLFKMTFDKESGDIVSILKGGLAVVCGGVTKFLFLNLVALKVFLPLLMPQVPPALSVTFGVLQLFTALIGGCIAYIVGFAVKKADLI